MCHVMCCAQVELVLRSASTWQFDAFKLRDATGGRPLSALAFYIMHTTGLVRQFKINGQRLAMWVCCTCVCLDGACTVVDWGVRG